MKVEKAIGMSAGGYVALVLVLGAFAMFSSGCTFGSSAHMGQHFSMSGTPDGIRAFGDTLNGAMRTAKENRNAPSEYFAARKVQEEQETIRDNNPSFLGKLFSKES